VKVEILFEEKGEDLVLTLKHKKDGQDYIASTTVTEDGEGDLSVDGDALSACLDLLRMTAGEL
jgi:hypothetical protein